MLMKSVLFSFQLRLMQQELNIEEVIKDRTLKVSTPAQ